MFVIASKRLCASSMMTMWPLNDRLRASRAGFWSSSGYGNVTIYTGQSAFLEEKSKGSQASELRVCQWVKVSS